MTALVQPAAPPRLGRSIAAIVIGFVVTAVLSLATDQVLHVLKVYPPWGQPMFEPSLNALALGYRIAFTIFGCWLTARLARRNPLKHAMILGSIGFVISTIGSIVAVTQMGELGPSWYPILLTVSALPCAWIGGKLRRQ